MKNSIIILLVFLLVGCSSTELVNNWKNPDYDTFAPSKILIVGMTSNDEARQKFEQKLIQKLKSEGIDAVASHVLFEEYYVGYRKTEKDLIELENNLIKNGFDSVLISKVIGVEDRTAFFNKYDSYNNTNYGFKDDYYNNQDVYFNRNYYDKYEVYHAETSLYCICKGEERTLIWKGYIDIIDPSSTKETVNDYVNLVLLVLEKQNLLN